MSPKVIEEEHHDFPHRNREHQEPADGRNENERWCYEAVEADEEKYAANVPLAATKQASLQPTARLIEAAMLARPAEQTIRLTRLRIDAPSRSPNDGTISVGPEEEPSIFQVATLPLLVFADASALSLILIHIRLILLESNELAEGIEYVPRQAPKDSSILPPTRSSRKDEAHYGAKGSEEGHPPAKDESPQEVEEEKPATNSATRCRMNITLSGLLDRTIFLVQGRLPYSDTEWMGLVDCLLSVFQSEALSIAYIVVLVVLAFVTNNTIAVKLIAAIESVVCCAGLGGIGLGDVIFLAIFGLFVYVIISAITSV